MEFQLSKSITSDEELREDILEMARARVAHLGARLSLLLVDFFFIVSDGEEEMIEIFRSLIALLEPKIRGRRLVVVDRIFALLETAEKEVRDRAKLNKLKSKANVKRPVRSKNPEIIYGFYAQILFLEEILSAVLTRPVWCEGLIRDFSLCEKELDAIGKEIDHLRLYGNDDHSHLRETMETKVRELWIGFEFDQ